MHSLNHMESQGAKLFLRSVFLTVENKISGNIGLAIYIIHTDVLPSCKVHVHVHSACAWCPRSPEEGIELLVVVFSDSCKLPWGCWESNLDPLKDQSVLLTPEPSL